VLGVTADELLSVYFEHTHRYWRERPEIISAFAD